MKPYAVTGPLDFLIRFPNYRITDRVFYQQLFTNPVIVTLFQVKMTMNGGDTKAQFTLEISVFKDKDYLLPYGIKEFPLKMSLSKPLFVQVKSKKL